MPIIHIEMDDTILHYTPAFYEAIERNPDVKYPQSKEGFYRNLKPIPDAIEAIKEIENFGYDIYILSCPSPLNPHSYTEKRLWIEEHLGADYIEKLILTMNKGLVKGDYLVDDWSEGRGQENFEGELIHYGSEQFPDWDKISSYLASKLITQS